MPIDPSGQITSLPIAEEGIHAKLLMEQLVRRSQAALAIQAYFEAKQIPYGIRVGRLAVTLAQETRALTGRKLLEKQAYDIELSQSEDRREPGPRLSGQPGEDLADRPAPARRGLAPEPPARTPGPWSGADRAGPRVCLRPRRPRPGGHGDCPRFSLLPGGGHSTGQAAAGGGAHPRRRPAHGPPPEPGAGLRLFGTGGVPAELSFKNTTAGNHGVALGAIFGATYSPPLVDVDLWARIRQARLDVIQSQLDLEKSLVDVANDAGNTWDRWQQAIKEWQQREAELALRREYLDRQERLYQQKQSIRLDVLGARVNFLQGDANRWTAWYNLQLARLDVLRATELLLDYVEKAGITQLPTGPEAPPPGFWKRRLAWLTEEQTRRPVHPEQGGDEPWSDRK